MRVRFTKTHDHTWPSRAVTNFPEGYEGTVRRVVGEAAIKAGAAEELPAQPGDVEPPADPVLDDVAEPEIVKDVVVRDVLPAAVAVPAAAPVAVAA